jgi:hypothetical protein
VPVNNVDAAITMAVASLECSAGNLDLCVRALSECCRIVFSNGLSTGWAKIR